VLNSDIKRDTPLSVLWVGYGYGSEVTMIAYFLARLGIPARFKCIDIEENYEKQGIDRWEKMKNQLTTTEKGKFCCFHNLVD
jgi:hypothetical protein